MGHVTNQRVGRKSPLLDPQEQVVPVSAWLVGRDLFDLEVLGDVLERAANAGKRRGHIGEGLALQRRSSAAL